MSKSYELTPETAGAYLRRNDVIPQPVEPSVASLGGGVSNHVYQVEWDGGCLVLKQPLPNLAVEDDWPADVTRVHNEAAAARAYRAVIETTGLTARVPDVAYEDQEAHLIAIECAPEEADMWKRNLLDGTVDPDIARAVGQVLGAVHSAAASDTELKAKFESKRPFDQLRIDPYHRTTADRHPDVRNAILAEVDRIMAVDRTLVHGDYSPKNVLVDRTGPVTPWILDFEVAHWGDPAFDTAFMCNHLFIKSIYNHELQDAYIDAAFEFWSAYTDHVSWDIEAETVAELGVLMLARVDGKSPVEYVEEGPIAAALRSVAKRTLREDLDQLEGFAELAREEAASL